MAVEGEADGVFAIDGEAVNDVGGVVGAEAGGVVVEEILGQDGDAHGRGVMGVGGLEFFGAEDGGADDALGGLEVFFEQDGGKGKGVGNVIEAIGGFILGEAFGGLDVDTEEIADGIGVLGAIEAAGGYATGVGFSGAVLAVEFLFERTDEGITFRGGRAGDGGGRHFAAFDTEEDTFPGFAVGIEITGVLRGSEIDVTGRICFVVAAVAVLLGEAEDVVGGAGAQQRGTEPECNQGFGEPHA